MPIRVLVADDIAAVRRSLELTIKAYADLELVGSATEGREAIQLSSQVAPDVVLLDAAMPHLCSVAVARFIRWIRPTTQVIGLVTFDDEEMARKLMVNGVDQCLLKNVSAEELSAAIREAYQRSSASPLMVHAMPSVPCPGTGCPREWQCSD